MQERKTKEREYARNQLGLLKYSLMTILFFSALSYANNRPTSLPYIQKNSSDTIQQYEKSFNFDWTDSSTIAKNKPKIQAVETLLRTINDYTQLSKEDREAAGRLYYKLGTFYTHVLREPDIAIDKMNMAALLLRNKQEQAWNYNHLAFAFELKFAATGQSFDKEKALNYIHTVIAKMYSNAKNKEVAFAYCVKGLLLSDAKDYLLAELSFKIAFGIYETLSKGKDNRLIEPKKYCLSKEH